MRYEIPLILSNACASSYVPALDLISVPRISKMSVLILLGILLYQSMTSEIAIRILLNTLGMSEKVQIQACALLN